MAKVETPADRYVRLLNERHSLITSSPEKSKQFLLNLGLKEVVKSAGIIKRQEKRNTTKAK